MSKMAVHFRNFRLLLKPQKSSFTRLFSTKFNYPLSVKDMCKRNIQDTNLFRALTDRKLSFLLSHFQDVSCTRSYYVATTLGIKASMLSKDNPLQKADVGCPICSGNISFTYKDVLFLSQFLSPEGNLLSKRVTGVCGKQQIKLEKAIKISRRLGLLPKCGPVTPLETSSS